MASLMGFEDIMQLPQFFYITLITVLMFSSAFFNVNSSPFEECKTPLTLSSTTDWYPYIFKNELGKSAGIDVALLTNILTEMQCDLTVVQFPERRSLFELKQGHMDIGLGASKNKTRIEKFYYSLPYRHEVNKFIYRDKDTDISIATSLTELLKSNKQIAINLAGWYGEEIESAQIDYNNFIFSDTVNKRLKMLYFNRVDVVIDDEVVLCSELLRSNYTGLSIHPMELYKADIHFIFNKKSISQGFVDEFNQVLKQMRTDGRLLSHFSSLLPQQCTLSVNNAG